MLCDKRFKPRTYESENYKNFKNFLAYELEMDSCFLSGSSKISCILCTLMP